MSELFTLAITRLPKSQQEKIHPFLVEFRRNPTGPGFNYEKIRGAKDKKLRSIRLDQAYRVIVARPEKGNVYLMLWVDKHDDAYAWAQNRVCDIHPETGAIQVIDTEVISKVKEEVEQNVETKLFSEIRDRELASLGVPEGILPTVRELTSEDELDAIAKSVPIEAHNALVLLAAGYTVEEVYRELGDSTKTKVIDINDFDTALETNESRSRFYVVGDDAELAEILNAPLEKWRVFLHPTQRRLVESSWDGPVRVLGGAGTGKTVVAMHRAKWLAKTVCSKPNDKILLTTFTRNLSEDIRENLKKICTEKEMERIDVINLDQWAIDYLRKHSYNFHIDYGNHTRKLWNKALDDAPKDLNMEEGFYREEWERIIQSRGIRSLEEYIKVSRVGRGTRLDRKQRAQVWRVFERYRELLDEHALKEPEDAIRDARMMVEEEGDAVAYKSIVVDEAQDMGEEAFCLIRALVPSEQKNDLFIVGDGHQRIYRHPSVLSRCGIDINNRSHVLRINYRTTEQIRKWATSLLEGCEVDDMDGDVENPQGYRSLLQGITPSVVCLRNFEEEVDVIFSYLNKYMDKDEQCSVCIAVRTNWMVEDYRNALKQKGIKLYKVRRDQADDLSKSGIRIATMHRVKGLEYDIMIIAGADNATLPMPTPALKSKDPVVCRDAEFNERALFYVAVTRAKKEVLVTCYGIISKFVNNIVAA